jgi:hypothetical protein
VLARHRSALLHRRACCWRCACSVRGKRKSGEESYVLRLLVWCYNWAS